MVRLGTRRRFVRYVVAAVVATAATLTVPAHDLPDDVARTALVSAFAPELALLRDELADVAVYSLNGVEFVTGTLQQHEVVLFLSGISVVSAAMTTQLGLDHFEIERIGFGTAGRRARGGRGGRARPLQRRRHLSAP